MSKLHASGVGLSLSGLRVGPLDPKTKSAKVGYHPAYQVQDQNSQIIPTFKSKERAGFSGGFKIPLEQRKAKLGRKIQHLERGEDEDAEEGQKNEITKEEIMAQLNLGSSQAAAGMGKHGTGSKGALTKDLIENLEKELDKLKRNEEGIKLRKRVALKGDRGSFDETEEDRQRARDQAVLDEMKQLGNNVIHAGEKRIQVVRHRVGQLDSVKALPYEELEALRLETAERLKVLEDQYWGKREAQGISSAIRDKYKSYGSNHTSTIDTPEQEKGLENDEGDKATSGILKNTRPGTSTGSLAKPKAVTLQSSAGKSTATGGKRGRSGHGNAETSPSRPKFGGDIAKTRSRSKSQKQRSPSPPAYNDPRQQIYEAKFEKYLANKQALREHDTKKKSMQKEDFDRYTKMQGSPSKHSKRAHPRPDPVMARLSGKYNADDLVPNNIDRTLVDEEELKRQQRARTDPFGALGVGAADKMTFFLLKWVFNAIKRESSQEDPKFKGQSYLAKADLVKQLAKNPELMRALGYEDQRQLADGLKLASGRKEGFLTWGEFLDFFFLGSASLRDRTDGNDWWNQLDSRGNYITKEKPPSSSDQKDEEKTDAVGPDGTVARASPGAGERRLPSRRPVKMTPSIQMLQESRAERAAREVEEEFARIAADQKAKQGQPAPQVAKKVPEYESLDTGIGGDGFGFSREKSKCLLLSSQIAIMEEVFKRLDRYDEGILRRSDFVMALRTDTRVIDFIDCEAVQKAYSTTIMTLDAVLLEIEKDERFDEANLAKDAINHKEFLTWREFLTYFHDYQDIEARNRKHSQMAKAQKAAASKAGQDDPVDGVHEMKTLMEQEKERRLEELPKLREADKIDINEKQLQLIKDIFDSVPRVGASKDSVNVLSFFLTIRKDPQIRSINTAVARDPEGCSRIPKETFQEVFDRMERELQQKQVDWATVVEYFTKRGRPLSKDEIAKLVDEDRREKEQELAKKRADEEAERRRNQRIMGDLEEEEDYEAFELRQKAERGPETSADDFERRFGAHDSAFNEEGSNAGSQDEDDYGEEQRSRAASAENIDLSRTKLTNADYVARAQTAKARKGKYGVTVPTPFGFDTREARRGKTIRETKVEEMVREKKVEEETVIRYQFRSKPIPPEVLIPKYQSILEADLARRQAVRSQSMAITAAREAPFSFWEREKHNQAKKKKQIEEHQQAQQQAPQFKANPIPRACSVLIFDKKMKQEELIRGKRIRKNAEIAFAKAKMPPTMQKHADRKKQEPPKKLEVEYSFKPDIGPRVTAKQLEEQAERFQRELAKKKGQKTQTVPRSPRFEKRPPKVLDRPLMNEGSKQDKQLDQYTEHIKKLAQSVKSLEGTVQTNPSSTKANVLAQQKRREELLQKRKREEAAKKEDEDRQIKQNEQKERVQSKLKEKFGKSAKEVIAEACAERKRDQRKNEKMSREKLKEAIEKGRSRPMLLDQDAQYNKERSNLAFLKATQKMIETIKKSGANPNRFLSDEQRELLEKEEIRQEYMKKVHGN